MMEYILGAAHNMHFEICYAPQVEYSVNARLPGNIFHNSWNTVCKG